MDHNPKTTILVVDDDEDVRGAIEVVLTAEGHTVVLACDGAEALKALYSMEPPNLVLMDLVMGRMGGQVLLDTLQASEQLRTIPVVVMSGVTVPADSFKCVAWLHKPFDIDELARIVARHARPA